MQSYSFMERETEELSDKQTDRDRTKSTDIKQTKHPDWFSARLKSNTQDRFK